MDFAAGLGVRPSHSSAMARERNDALLQKTPLTAMRTSVTLHPNVAQTIHAAHSGFSVESHQVHRSKHDQLYLSYLFHPIKRTRPR